MTDSAHQLAERLRDEMVEIMIAALKKDGAVYLTDDEYYRLREKLGDAIRGEIRL